MKRDRLFGNAIMRLAAKATRQNMADSSVHGRMMLMSIMLCGMGLFAETPIVTGNAYGYTWTFKLLDGRSAAITSCSPEPHGDLKIPSELKLNEEIWKDGAKIVSVPVSSVEEGSFANCTRLTSVEFPNSSSFFHIRANAFDGCSNLVTVTMHSGVASIGEQAFASCVGIKTIEVPKSLMTIGEGVFWGCCNITNMVLPFVGTSRGGGRYGDPFGRIFSKGPYTGNGRSAPYIGEEYDGSVRVYQTEYAFYYFNIPSGLQSVTITDDTELKNAFMNCSMITEINLANTITNICGDAFKNCTGLSQIKIPSSAVAVSGFDGCTGLRAVHTDDLAAWSSADFDSGPLVYAHNLYYKGELVQNLVIPDGVVNIGTFAFKDCTSIHSVTLPNSLKSIGYGAFNSCANLSGEVKIPDSVTSVKNRAFAGCTRLNRVDCGNGVKNLGDNNYHGGGEVFGGCVNLSTVILPNSISVLTHESVADCGIEELFIPDSVIQLGGQSRGWMYPFRGCSRLRRVRLPQSACDIPLKTLFPDSPISSVEVSSQVKMLKGGIFADCSTLKDVTIPSSVTNINSSAFGGCGGLSTISVAEENRHYSSKEGLLLSKDGRTLIHGVNGDVRIPDGVTEINNDAFGSCGGLTSITIPSSVTCIGYSAFSKCEGLSAVHISDLSAWCRIKFYPGSNPLGYAHNLYLNGTLLTKLDIPDSIDVIGDYTFYGCRCLTSVTIPDSVTSIGQYALSGCNGLENLFFLGDAPSYYNNTFPGVGTVYVHRGSTGWGVSIPGRWQGINIRYVGEPYFEINSNGTLTKVDLNGATEVVIPDNVTSIGDTAFLSCSNLTAVTIGANVRSIETDAFVGCSEIRSVTIPQAVCSSGMSTVFPSAYQSITNVAISEGVTTLEYRLFYGCTNLVSVTMPSSVRRVEADAFLGCNKLAGVFISDLAAWCGIEFVMDSIYSSNNAANPLRYAHNLYLNGLLISDLVIPEGVKSVSDMTFYNCTNILSVTIPEGVTNIGERAFSYCSSLTRVTISDSVKNIGQYAFFLCDNLEGVYITDLAAWCDIEFAFNDMYGAAYSANPLAYAHKLYLNGTSAEEIAVPNGVTRIGEYAFYNCTNITSVTIPDSVSKIGKRAFYGCVGLEDMTIGDGVKDIGERTFYRCENLDRVTIGNGVTNIGYEAFERCSKMKAVHITDLAAWCRIRFDRAAANPLYGSEKLYLDGKLITNLSIPDGVTTIGSWAFEHCKDITSVTIPDGVTSVGNYAFCDCQNLRQVTVPSSVTRIGTFAFASDWWANIYFKGTPPDVFDYGGLDSTESVGSCNGIYLPDYKAEWESVVDADGRWHGLAMRQDNSTPDPDPDPLPGTPEFTIENGTLMAVELNEATEIVIPDDVKSIGRRALSFAELVSVTIPVSVTNIHPYAFDNCSGLMSISVAAGNPYYKSVNGLLLTKDGKTLVQGVNGDVVIPNGVTCIGDSAFYGCNGLTSVIIPNGVTNIDEYAFGECYELASVTIPASVTTIGEYAFDECSGLTDVVFQGNAPIFGDDALYLSYVEEDDSYYGVNPECVIHVARSSTGWGVDIPGTWNGIRIEYIDSSSPTIGKPRFTIVDGELTDVDLNGATEVTVPDGVTSIRNYAFELCENLVSVVIPNGVTNIGDGAFDRCHKLVSVKLPPSLRSIGNWAFSRTAIESIDLPNGLTSLGEYAFAYSELKSITIPSGITVIPYAAFCWCPLTHITIPASVTSIDDWAFESPFIEHESVPVVFGGNAPITVSPNAFAYHRSDGFTAYGHRDSTGWGVPIPGTWKGMKIRHIGSREVIFDANGGKPAKQTLEQFASEAWDVDGLQQPSMNGVAFGGWWTAKTGGERVDLDGVCTLSGDTTLYARWLKTYKATAKDGIVYTDESEDIGSSVSALNGTRLYLEAADKSDKNMEFAYWSCSPATVELCDDFDLRSPYLECIMPEANVTFTANYASKPGYVCVCVYEVNDTDNDDGEPEGIEWSADGKFWLAANDGWAFPVKSGRTTLKLRSTDPRWTVPASATCTVENDNTVLDVDIAATRVAVITTDVLLEQSEASGTVTMNPKNGQVLSGKPVTLTAKPGKDTVFAYWLVDGEKVGYTSTFKYAPDVDSTAVAVFRLKSGVEDPVLDESAVVPSANAMVGVAFSMSVPLDDAAYPAKFAASKLPAGLKIDAASGMISGVPTKAGDYAVTVTAAGGANGKAKSSMTLPITIKPLPEWAQGTFTGCATSYVEEDDEDVSADAGLATFTVSTVGKVSGKVSLCGTNWTFSATSYDAASTTGAADEDLDGAEEFVIAAEMKSGKIVKPLRLTVTRAAPPQDDGEVLQNASVWGWTTSGMESFELCRTMWKDKSTVAASKAVLAAWEGVYTLSLGSAEDYGSGYLSLTVGKDGNVKATGKLADGTGVSATSPLMYDEENGGFFAYLYAAPSAYKGGCLALAVGFDAAGARDARPYQLAPVMFEPQWTSRNPQATDEYGEGFDRILEFSGAYYDKLKKLNEYYEQMRLSLDDMPTLAYTYKSTYLDDDTGRKVTESWLDEAEAVDTLSQDGITVAVDEKGKIVVAKATKPVQDRETKEWYYEGANDGALTLSFTQATGIFKGSYTFWYDYESAYDGTRDKETIVHTSKKVNFEGIMVQGEESLRGFYLWDATGVYEDEKTGREKTYRYKQSYPVLFHEP